MEGTLKTSVPTPSEMGLSTGIVHLVGAGPQSHKNLPFRTRMQADAFLVLLATLMNPDSCQGLISLGTRPDAALAGAWLHLILPGHISTTDQLGCSQQSDSVQNPGQNLVGIPSCPSAAHCSLEKATTGDEEEKTLCHWQGGAEKGLCCIPLCALPSAAHAPSQPFTAVNGRSNTWGGKFHKN